MPVGFLDVVEGDFHHDHRIDIAHVPVIFDRVLQEKLGQLCDFGVAYARICLADIHQPP